MNHVNGFEFLVNGEWIQLQGAGGQIGNGCICALNSDNTRLTVDGVTDSVLKEARRFAKRGDLRRYIYNPDGPGTIYPISGTVEAARAVFDRGAK